MDCSKRIYKRTLWPFIKEGLTIAQPLTQPYNRVLGYFPMYGGASSGDEIVASYVRFFYRTSYAGLTSRQKSRNSYELLMRLRKTAFTSISAPLGGQLH